MGATLPPVTRADIKAVIISAQLELPGLPFVIDVLPAGSRVIVESGSLRYTTAHLADALFRDSFIRNDLTGHDDVRIATPLNRQELRNPRQEDKELARNLLDHLNENIERYHHWIWSQLSDARRYAPRRLPGSEQRRTLRRERGRERAHRHCRKLPGHAGRKRLSSGSDLSAGRRAPRRPVRALSAEHADRAQSRGHPASPPLLRGRQ